MLNIFINICINIRASKRSAGMERSCPFWAEADNYCDNTFKCNAIILLF